MNRYTLGASVRFDGSDLYGVAKKYRFLPLYSFSGLWRASDEPWLRESTVINNLAFRASYGIQGNIDKNTSSFVMGNYNNASILPGVTEDVIVLGSAPNRRLRWEKTYTTNAGFDISVIDNAISLTADYYHRKGDASSHSRCSRSRQASCHIWSTGPRCATRALKSDWPHAT